MLSGFSLVGPKTEKDLGFSRAPLSKCPGSLAFHWYHTAVSPVQHLPLVGLTAPFQCIIIFHWHYDESLSRSLSTLTSESNGLKVLKQRKGNLNAGEFNFWKQFGPCGPPVCKWPFAFSRRCIGEKLQSTKTNRANIKLRSIRPLKSNSSFLRQTSYSTFTFSDRNLSLKGNNPPRPIAR